jgi:hypothetical protein
LQTRLFPQEIIFATRKRAITLGDLQSVNQQGQPHLDRQLLCYFGQKHASVQMSFSFADPKSHAAEKQGKNYYQYFVPLILIGPWPHHKQTTHPATFVGWAACY